MADLVLTNALIIDYDKIVKADIGVKNVTVKKQRLVAVNLFVMAWLKTLTLHAMTAKWLT